MTVRSLNGGGSSAWPADCKRPLMPSAGSWCRRPFATRFGLTTGSTVDISQYGAGLQLVPTGAVPVLDNLEAVVDLASEVGVGEVVADERGADGAAELFERLVGGVLGAAAGEAPQHLLGFGGPEAQGGGVLDELVVLPGDELPSDRARRDLLEAWVGGAVGGPVEAGGADLLEAGQQLEAALRRTRSDCNSRYT